MRWHLASVARLEVGELSLVQRLCRGRTACSQNKVVNHSLATGSVCHPYTGGTKGQQVTEAQDHVHMEEAETIWGSSSWKWATDKTVPLGETLLRQRSKITPTFPAPISQHFLSLVKSSQTSAKKSILQKLAPAARQNRAEQRGRENASESKQAL